MPLDIPEAARLRALHRSGLIEATSREQFDSLTELVCDMLGVPISFVSIVSNDRQVFAGHCGLPAQWAERGETPLTRSFCRHVVERGAPMCIDDAKGDPTVHDNPAIPEVGIAAYLGVPIHLPSGEIVGSFAAVDTAPRVWTQADMRRLERVAAIATQEIAVRVSEVKWRSLFADMREGFFVGEAIRDGSGRMLDFRYVDANPAFETLTGLSLARTVGRPTSNSFPAVEPALLEHFDTVLESGEPAVLEIRLPRFGNAWFELRTRALDHDRVAVLLTDIDGRKNEEIGRAEVDERRRLATDVGEVGLWDLDIVGSSLVLDARMRRLNGVVSSRDVTMADAFGAIHPEDRERVERELGSLAEDGEDTIETQYRVIGIEDAIVRTVQVNGRRLRDGEGKSIRLIGAARDISNRVARDERRTVLNQELAHRLKNTLAIVVSIITQTLRTAADVETGRKTLLARIHALSKAHDILLSGQKGAATVQTIVAGAVALHDEGGRVKIEGTSLPLGPKAALTLSLIVHELATNAGKYGALSVPEGVVEVKWTQPGADGGGLVLDLVWIEKHGPKVIAPTRRGFGTRLVEMGLSGSSGGSVSIDYAPEGLRCRIVAPLVELMHDDEVDE